MKKEPIYVTQPSMPELDDFIPYLKEIWGSKWLTNNGKFHKQLEDSLCEYLGVKYLSLFSNGTLALITALQTLRITGEVITTPFSFVATTHAIHWNGIKPVFCDIEPEFMTLDADKIESAITPKTTAILPVHIYGNPCNVDRISKIADTYGLKVIYDACHAFGVEINGKSVLEFGELSVLSFHATKVFTTFEGGAIISHDEKTKKRVDFLKNFGFADEETVVAPGINAKMSEVQSAFGLLQLKSINDVILKRKEKYDLYRKLLEGRDGIRFLDYRTSVKPNYAYIPVFINEKVFGKSRDKIYNDLRDEEIYARKYFYPLISQFPSYKNLPSASKENLPVAEDICREVLCMPLYPNLDNKDIKKIVDIIIK
ncbi:MAG: DegT/DnrJ/EryC1/StrS family aminotransferase [Ignavibacteriae bacterium]|nr:DegT/DnrJ/EryC1/StrS family aminotransferase [Ignavibacteriota bacterium]